MQRRIEKCGMRVKWMWGKWSIKCAQSVEWLKWNIQNNSCIFFIKLQIQCNEYQFMGVFISLQIFVVPNLRMCPEYVACAHYYIQLCLWHHIHMNNELRNNGGCEVAEHIQYAFHLTFKRNFTPLSFTALFDLAENREPRFDRREKRINKMRSEWRKKKRIYGF